MAITRTESLARAHATYEHHRLAALHHLAEIQAYLEAEIAGETVTPHWGHVGSMADINHDLNQVSDRIQGRGEWAV